MNTLLIAVSLLYISLAGAQTLPEAFSGASQSLHLALGRMVLGHGDPVPSQAQPPVGSVSIGDRAYFIDQGHVFSADPAGRTVYLHWSEKITSLLAYRDGLIALDAYGNAYLWDSPRRYFQVIGNKVARLAVDGDDLVATTHMGAVIRYAGEHGASLRWVASRVHRGRIESVRWTPYIGARPLSLSR